MKFKKDLFKLNLTDIDLDDAKIFINQSLCPYYKILWSKSKRLLRFNCNGQGKTLGKQSITHATDVDKHFPGINLSSPSQMYQSCSIDPVVFNFYDVRVFFSTFWCIYIQRLCLFSVVDPFVRLIYFPPKICLFATITTLLDIILMSFF